MTYFHSTIAFIIEFKTRDELPEHVLTSSKLSYIKRKQDEILIKDEAFITPFEVLDSKPQTC